MKIHYTTSEEIEINDGTPVLYLKSGTPAVWIFHPDNEQLFTGYIRSVGLEPVKIEGVEIDNISRLEIE